MTDSNDEIRRALELLKSSPPSDRDVLLRATRYFWTAYIRSTTWPAEVIAPALRFLEIVSRHGSFERTIPQLDEADVISAWTELRAVLEVLQQADY